MLAAAMRQRQLASLARFEPPAPPQGGARQQHRDRPWGPRRRQRSAGILRSDAAEDAAPSSDATRAAQVAFNGFLERFEGRLDTRLDALQHLLNKSGKDTLAAVSATAESQRELMQILMDEIKHQRMVLRCLLVFCVCNAVLPAGWLVSLVDSAAWLLAALVQNMWAALAF